MIACPHGDPTCPCPSGDACHYEGTDARVCPNPPAPAGTLRVYALGPDGKPTGSAVFVARMSTTSPHCHVEGCRWEAEGCGLVRLGLVARIPAGDERTPVTDPWWRCGATRAADWLWIDDPEPWHGGEGTDEQRRLV